jgi:hypothetical protein
VPYPWTVNAPPRLASHETISPSDAVVAVWPSPCVYRPALRGGDCPGLEGGVGLGASVMVETRPIPARGAGPLGADARYARRTPRYGQRNLGPVVKEKARKRADAGHGSSVSACRPGGPLRLSGRGPMTRIRQARGDWEFEAEQAGLRIGQKVSAPSNASVSRASGGWERAVL